MLVSQKGHFISEKVAKKISLPRGVVLLRKYETYHWVDFFLTDSTLGMIPASQPAAIKWYGKELTPQERGPT